MTRITVSAATPVAQTLFISALAIIFGFVSAEDDHWDHEHSEEPMLTGSELAGIVCGVLAGAIILTIVSLCLLRHFDPRAWGRLVNCMRSISSCNLSGPEHPDQPVKSRDLEDLTFIEVKQPEKVKDETSLDLSNEVKKELSQPLKSDDEGQDQVDQKEMKADNPV